MKIMSGDPPVEGRYVAFTPCQSSQIVEWAEPVIATFQGGRWHCAFPVMGYLAGVIEPVKVSEFKLPLHRKYDL